MTTDRISETDPRVLALARARQQLAHQGMLHPTWDELTDAERAQALPEVRNWLQAAADAGLLRQACEHSRAASTGVLAHHQFEDAEPVPGMDAEFESQGKGAVIVYAGRCPDCREKVYNLALNDWSEITAEGLGTFSRVPWTAARPEGT